MPAQITNTYLDLTQLSTSLKPVDIQTITRNLDSIRSHCSNFTKKLKTPLEESTKEMEKMTNELNSHSKEVRNLQEQMKKLTEQMESM